MIVRKWGPSRRVVKYVSYITCACYSSAENTADEPEDDGDRPESC
jgi:hypothetical protein